MRYLKRIIYALFAFFLLLAMSPISDQQNEILLFGESVVFKQGEVISGCIMGKPINQNEISVNLVNKHDVTKIYNFDSSLVSNGPCNAGLFIVPVAYDLIPGDYYLQIRRSDESEYVMNTDISIEPSIYIEETIVLDDAISKLRQEENAQRRSESEELWELIQTKADSQSLFYGQMELPVKDAVLSSSFGDRRIFNYSSGNTSRSIHWGIDLAAKEGSPVLVPADGRVVMSRNRLITGNTIVIEHFPGVYSLLYHLHELYVKQGDMVSIGEIIGSVGSTGVSTGPHLHWEVRVFTIPVNPLFLLEKPLVPLDTKDKND